MRNPESEETIGGVEIPAPGTFFEKLAEKLGATARAARIFGEPVERDGVTVIPVATARWGLGGGGGRKGLVARGEGMGGGGGVVVRPAGYIEIRGGGARYRPIVDPKVLIGAGIAGAFLAFRLLRRLRS
jgi:uncharacterized spore protein YtfJ